MFVMIIGVILKRFTQVNALVLSTILIFIATPAMVFLGAYELQLSPGLILLPFLVCALGVLFSLIYGYCFKNWWDDSTDRLLSVAVGTSNTGYFGLPMTIAVLGADVLPIAVMFAFGQILFVNTFGYYLAARHQFSIETARAKLFSLPVLYALILGLLINYFDFKLDIIIENTVVLLADIYIPLGMVLIGVMLASLKDLKLDFKYLTAITLNKFFVWPLAIIGIIVLDYYLFQLLSKEVYSVMLLQSIAPSGANMAAFASQFNLHPDKAALGILITTLIAIFYMPLVGGYLISFL